MTTAVTVDVNVFVSAVVGGNDTFQSWPSPPPVRGNLAANVVGILNDSRELSLFLSEHILANVVRVLTGTPPHGYGWAVERTEEYIELLVEIAESSGGAIIESSTITDCPDHEDNRILECASASGSMLIVSDDTDLTAMSPWRGTPVVTAAEFVTRTDAMRRGHRRSRIDRQATSPRLGTAPIAPSIYSLSARRGRGFPDGSAQDPPRPPAVVGPGLGLSRRTGPAQVDTQQQGLLNSRLDGRC